MLKVAIPVNCFEHYVVKIVIIFIKKSFDLRTFIIHQIKGLEK